eukprot:CAMPEP_0176424166 /NCGR_PEP_ID=MMETSP0127-20121128/10689_1 /TAXON_ID=938130 /ORGANISM="Platyophrya macrostoma, Strain WH" /LENGTH=925 /DNA_ID=CAMNT_0017805199 /DNA_START=25 /DNA_END=2802 /DNA_ORIENTATION=+
MSLRTFPLQLKATQATDIYNPLSKFIGQKYGPDALKASQGTLKNVQDIRNSFDFVKSASQINNDFRLCAELQEQLVLYLKYIAMIDHYFKTDFSDPRGVKIAFSWNDSFQPTKKKTINHSKYELAGVLFNLATCYYIDGNIASTSVKDEDKLKALGKLRTCLWCINELKQTLPSLLVNPQDIPSDLDITFINLLSNYVTGLCYGVLLDIAQKDTKKYGPDRLASINKVASKHFQIALDIVNATWKNSPIPENARKGLRATLLFTATYHRTQAYYQQALNHIILQQDEDRVREGHMGLATSHLRQSLNVINGFLNNKKDVELLGQQQKGELVAMAQEVKTKYEEIAFKNKNIFQDIEYPPEQLPEIPDEKMVIGAVEPKGWKDKLEDEKYFECFFLSPELKAVKQEIHQAIDAKKQEVETNLKSANTLRNKHYAEGYINYLIALDPSGTKKNELPPKLKAGIDKFHKNGGSTNYENIKEHIAQASKNCKGILEQIKEMIAKEKSDDEEMRKKYPQVWNRPYSEAINQENILNLRDLEQKYYIAIKADEEVAFKFTKAKDWMTKLSQPQDVILQMLNPTSDSEFFTQNKDKILALQQAHEQLNKLVDLELKREEIKNITEAYKKQNYIAELQQMVPMNPQDRQQAIQKLLAPLDNDFAKINTGIQESYPILDAMVKSAKAMNETRSSSNQNAIKILEDMSQAVTQINEIFDDFAQGTEFYDNLSYYLGLLQATVSDFCIAREIDRQNRAQDLESKQQQFNVQKPYFTEDKFAQGTSTFIVGNFLNKQNQQSQPNQPIQQQQQKSVMPNTTVQSNLFGQQMGIQQQQQFGNPQNMGYPGPGQQYGYQQSGVYQQQPIYQQQPNYQQQSYMPQQGFQQPTYQQQPVYQQQPNYQQQQPTQQQQQQNKGPFAGFSYAESTFVSNPTQPKK